MKFHKKAKTRSRENSHLFWLTGYMVENLIEYYFIHRSWSTCTFMTISCTQKLRTWTSEFDTEWSFTWLVKFLASGRILRKFSAYTYWHMYRLFVFFFKSFFPLSIFNWVEWLWNPSDSFVICFCGPESAQLSKEFLSFWLYWPIKMLH